MAENSSFSKLCRQPSENIVNSEGEQNGAYSFQYSTPLFVQQGQPHKTLKHIWIDVHSLHHRHHVLHSAHLLQLVLTTHTIALPSAGSSRPAAASSAYPSPPSQGPTLADCASSAASSSRLGLIHSSHPYRSSTETCRSCRSFPPSTCTAA